MNRIDAPRAPVRRIMEAVAGECGITVEHIKSRRRSRRYVRPRHLAMYLTRELTAHTLPEIGMYFDRDHTTVLYGIRCVEDRMLRDGVFAKYVANLAEKLDDVIGREGSLELAIESALSQIRTDLLSAARTDPSRVLSALAAIVQAGDRP